MKIEKGIVEIGRLDGVKLDGVAKITSTGGVQDDDNPVYRKYATEFNGHRDVIKMRGDEIVWIKIYA